MNIVQSPASNSNIFTILPFILHQPDVARLKFKVWDEVTTFYEYDSLYKYPNQNGDIIFELSDILIDFYTNNGNIVNGNVAIKATHMLAYAFYDLSAQESDSGEITITTGPLSDFVVIQKPDAVFFASDALDYIILSESDLQLIVEIDGNEIINEYYKPYLNKVQIDLRSLLSNYFNCNIPDLNLTYDIPFNQLNQVGLVKIKHKRQEDSDEEYVENIFNCINGGIGKAQNGFQQIRSEFLTNQPQVYFVSKKVPLFLSFFREKYSEDKIRMNAWFQEHDYDDGIIELGYFTSDKGKIVTSNFGFDKLERLFGSSNYIAIDIYFEKSIFTGVQGEEIEVESKPQRFIFNPSDDINSEFFYFENLQGSIEMICFTGESIEKQSHELEIAKIERNIQDYMSEYSVVYTKNTGFFRNKQYRKQAVEFLVSRNRWKYNPETKEFRKIFIHEFDAKAKELALNSFEFSWSYSDDNQYRLEDRLSELPTHI